MPVSDSVESTSDIEADSPYADYGDYLRCMAAAQEGTGEPRAG